MNFVSFSVTNSRGKIMQFCMEEYKADIMIEKVYNMGSCTIRIDV